VARIAVVGGGFGGIAAATRLRRGLDPTDEVVLIARDHRFAMGWTKIWDLVGIRPLAEGVRELPTLERQGIRFVHADVTGLDATSRGIATTAGDVEADGLVVALGAEPGPEAGMLDGVVGHDLYSFAALEASKRALGTLTSGRLVVAVLGQPFKCPPAPFEAVLAIDEWLRDRGRRDDVELEIATPSPGALPVAGPDASRAIADRLVERDIGMRLQHLVTGVDGRRVTFDTGASTDADLLLGVPGAAPPAVLADSGIAGPSGFVHPDPRTLATTVERVYAVGDCTTVPTATAALPKAGVFAAAEGEVAAANLLADLGHGPPATFDGHGHCYLELPGREVAVVEGDFFAEPAPQVTLSPPSAAGFEAKLAFEAARLRDWFGA
jgi:sulfide:quinone oxidoreductase